MWKSLLSPEFSGKGSLPLNSWPVMPTKVVHLLGLGLALAANIYLAGRIGVQANHYFRYDREAAALRAEIARLEALYQARLRQRDYYRSDAYLEQVARENLGLVGPGEKLVVSPAADRPAGRMAQADRASAGSEAGGGLWARLAALIGGR